MLNRFDTEFILIWVEVWREWGYFSPLAPPKTTAENKETNMILAVRRFTAQIGTYRLSHKCLPPIFPFIPVQKQTGATRFNCPALFTKSSFPFPLSVSLCLSLSLARSRSSPFPPPVLFPAPLYLWKRHFKSLPVWISLVFFLCVSPCQ